MSTLSRLLLSGAHVKPYLAALLLYAGLGARALFALLCLLRSPELWVFS